MFNLLFALLCALAASPSPPEPAPLLVSHEHPPQTLSIDYPDADIKELLGAVGRHFGLKLDLPRRLNGRTSLKLRAVTWRQIFQVVLSPIGYDFYEEDGVVIVRTSEEIAALPPVFDTVPLQHANAHEAAVYLNRVYRGNPSFASTENGLVYQVNRKMQRQVRDEIHRLDEPGKVLIRFKRTPRLPKELPALAPALGADGNGDTGASADEVTTHIFIFDHIDAELAVPYLEKALRTTKGARVIWDMRINGLIVTAPESRLPHLEAIVVYLDTERWYEAEASPTESLAPTHPPSP